MSAATLHSTRRSAGPFRVTTLVVKDPAIPQAFSGYRIVQLTDLHFGPLTPKSHLRRAFELVADENPDLIVMTGDAIQNSALGLRQVLATQVHPKVFRWMEYRRQVRQLTLELSELFAALSAPDGLLGVLGNHEYTEGVGTVLRFLDPRITWLRNERTFITRGPHTLQISGIEDLTRGKPDLLRSLEHPNTHREPFMSILLSHNPDVAIDAEHKALADVTLTLSGHTHGGQICMPGFGPIVTRTKQRKHVTGLTQHHTESWIYVCNGLGFGGLPFRFCCPPEILVVQLEA